MQSQKIEQDTLRRTSLRRPSRAVAPVAALVAAASFVVAGTSAPALAVAGGSAQTQPWFARIEMSGGSCSGSLISPTAVLTAQHCVADLNASGDVTSRETAKDVVAYIGYRDPKHTGTKVKVSKIVTAPGYTSIKQPEYGKYRTIVNDVAVLVLSKAVIGVTPLWVAPSPKALTQGVGIRLYGDGDGAKKTPTLQQRATADGDYTLDKTCPAAIQGTVCFLDVSSATSYGASGDSGGPWVATVGGHPVLMGTFTGYVDPVDQPNTGRAYGAGMSQSFGDLIRTTAGIPTASAGNIVRDPANGHSWLINSQGYRTAIPDGGTYLCLTGNGSQVSNLSTSQLALMPELDGVNATCHNGGNVLIYGDGDFGEDQTGFTNLSNALEDSNFTVTVLPGVLTLPDDLSSFAEIWHYGIDTPSATDQDRLVTFAKNGGGVFLTGERPCCETENQADSTIINDLVVSVGGIQVGGLGDIGSCGDSETINQSAVGSVATYPNALTTWKPVCPGGLGNVAARNVFATAPDGATVAAVWGADDVVGGGKLAILMDVNWAQDNYKDPSTMAAVAQNLAAFLH